jgi:hypothetical protein
MGEGGGENKLYIRCKEREIAEKMNDLPHTHVRKQFNAHETALGGRASVSTTGRIGNPALSNSIPTAVAFVRSVVATAALVLGYVVATIGTHF